jgi:hypothetical protein
MQYSEIRLPQQVGRLGHFPFKDSIGSSAKKACGLNGFG